MNVVEPSGYCWCGCGNPTSGFFVDGHEADAVRRVVIREYGSPEAFLAKHGSAHLPKGADPALLTNNYADNPVDPSFKSAEPEWLSSADRSLLLLFVHIPKTGGTLLKQLLTKAYGRYFTDHHARVKPLDGVAEYHDLLAISSHVAYGYHLKYPAFSPRVAIPFAVVREPIDRLISLYNFVTTFENHRLFDATRGMDPNQFFTFLLDNNEIQELQNGQCRVLTDQVESSRLAIEIIETEFLAVAPLERVRELADRLISLFGWPVESSKGRPNQSPKLLTNESLSPALRSELEKMNEEDQALYDYVAGRKSDLFPNSVEDLRRKQIAKDLKS